MDSIPTPGSHDISINMGPTDEVVLPVGNQPTAEAAVEAGVSSAAPKTQDQYEEYIPRLSLIHI